MSGDKKRAFRGPVFDLSVECGQYCQGGTAAFEATAYPDDFSVVRFSDAEKVAQQRDELAEALRQIADFNGSVDDVNALARAALAKLTTEGA